MRESQPGQRVGYLAMSVALLVGAIIFTSMPADTDLWGHVRFGQDKLRHGIDRTTTYSYTTTDQPWINHEWLSEVFMALTVNGFGPRGLIAAKCMLGLGVLLMIWHIGNRCKAHIVSIASVVIIVSANLLTGWMARPKLLTFFCFSLMIVVLHHAFFLWETDDEKAEFPSWDNRLHWLWVLPPVFVFWTNVHGGFLAGIVVLFTYMGLRFGQTCFVHRGKATRLGCYLLAVAGVVCAATLLNPYGLDLHRWLYGSLGEARPEITEWQSLDATTPSAWNVGLLVGVGAVTLMFSKRKWDYVHLFVFLAITIQSLLHIRHIPFLALLFGFYWVKHVDSFLMPESFLSELPKRVNTGAVAALFGVLLVELWILVPQFRGIEVSRERYPVSAFEFIDKQDLSGRIFVSFDWAQYAIGVFGDRSGEDSDGVLRVAYDGRFRTCYSQQIIDYGFDFELGNSVPRNRDEGSDTFGDSKILSLHDPNLVLIHSVQGNASKVMERIKGTGKWTLLYKDSLAELWGLSTLYDTEDKASYVPPQERSTSSTKQEGFAWWPAKPSI